MKNTATKATTYLVYNAEKKFAYWGTRNADGRIVTRGEQQQITLAKIKSTVKTANTRAGRYTQSNWKKTADNGVEQTFEATLKKN